MVDMAAGCLISMGLTECSQFAPLVVVCAHRSQSFNNPFAHSLGCGACGGYSGEDNAIALATMLNKQAVREGLAARGIFVPEGTWFLPALHNTTTDEVSLLTAEIPATHKAAVDEIVHDFKVAGDKLREKREASLPRTVFPSYSRARVRAFDPAQTLPEWGLFGCRHFVVGPRTLLPALQSGKAFGHTYDWRKDADGAVLNAILSGAGRVASGINLQYLFSALFPKTLGAGDKTLGNPAGIIGIKRGRSGDLRIGLTEQSAGFQNGVLVEHPVRLLWLIEAPRATIDRVLEQNQDLAHLAGNGWVRLIAKEGSAFFKAGAIGDWAVIGW
jgi:uncharacterized protein YbcC (UPF0753/DUF2309 family)